MAGKMDQPAKAKRQERRKYTRIEKHVQVMANKLTYPVNDSNFQDGQMLNISEGGLLFTMPQQFNQNTVLQLRITLPGWRKDHPGFIRVLEDSIGSPLTALGEVTRVSQSGNNFETAVKFINMDSDDRVALQRYLERDRVSSN